MVIDSTVLIDYLRGNDSAKNYILSAVEPFKISRVVVMELIAGSKNRQEVKKNLQFITNLELDIVEINEEISQQAGKLFENYFHQYGLGITDALIAAMAIVAGDKLVTHNVKHFKFIKELDIIKPY